jgi:hypothetical protein
MDALGLILPAHPFLSNARKGSNMSTKQIVIAFLFATNVLAASQAISQVTKHQPEVQSGDTLPLAFRVIESTAGSLIHIPQVPPEGITGVELDGLLISDFRSLLSPVPQEGFGVSTLIDLPNDGFKTLSVYLGDGGPKISFALNQASTDRETAKAAPLVWAARLVIGRNGAPQFIRDSLISQSQAINILKNGGSIFADTQYLAKQLATSAWGKGNLVQHWAHKIYSFFRPHYQHVKSHIQGHAFW